MHNDVIERTIFCNDRAEWLQARREGIGSSDAAAIMRQSSWSTPYKVHLDKKGLLTDTPRDDDRLELGHAFEPIIDRFYAKKTHRETKDLGDFAIVKHPTIDCMIATVDRLDHTLHGVGVSEYKTVSGRMHNHYKLGPSKQYLCQVQHQLACTGYKRASIVGLFGMDFDIRYWDVERNDQFIELLENNCVEFWERFVEGDETPELTGMQADSEALRSIKAEEGSIYIPELHDWANEFDHKKTALEQAKESFDQIKNTIKAAIGTHVSGSNGDTILFTYSADKNGKRTLRRTEIELSEVVV